MDGSRKVLYISTGVNFLIGIIAGIILFYGQMRTDASVFEEVYVYSTEIKIIDFLKVLWTNLLWLFGIFVFHNLLPVPILHPAVMLRGCCSSFSVMYILNFMGVKEAATAIIPQCFSVLPLMFMFSVYTVLKRRKLLRTAEEPFTVKRKELTAIVSLAFLAGVIEILAFRFFSVYLF